MDPYYQDSAVQIFLGDCLEIMPQLGKVDSAITDPPYEEEAHTLQRRAKKHGGVMEVEPLEFDAITEEERIASALLLSEKVRRWALVFCQIEAAMLWRESFNGSMNYRRSCIWVKPDGMPQYSGDRPGMGYETIVAMHTKGKSTWNGRGRHGVFTVNKADGWPNGAPHPTTKPQKLMRLLVKLFTDPDETILDPFMGAGSTLRAAKDLGRRAIGIEKKERHCETAANRMSQEVLPLETQTSGTEVTG